MSKKFLNSMHEIGGILNWKISNFRSVGSGVNEQEVELAPLTIICGENSSGKSSLLHSILLTQQLLNDSWQSENTDGEVIDLNGRYVQLGDFKSLVNLSQNSSNSINNQIGISFQTLDLNAENLAVPYKSLDIKFSDNYQDGKVKADELNMEYLTIPDFRKFFAFPINKKQDLTVTHNAISIDRKNEKNIAMDIFNDHFFEGAKNNWDCTYGIQNYGFREITTDSTLDLDWLKFETLRDRHENFKSTIIDFSKLVNNPSLINKELNFNAVKFKGGIPQEVAFEHDFIDYFAAFFSQLFVNYFNLSNYKSLYEKLKSIDTDDIPNSSQSELDSFIPDYQEDITPDYPYDDSELDEINYNFAIPEDVENPVEEEYMYLEEEDFFENVLTELAELFELNYYEGDLLFNFEYRFGDVLDLPYANKLNVDNVKSLEKDKRNEFVEAIYYDLVTFIGGLQTLEKNPNDDVITAIEQVFRSILLNAYVPEAYFESIANDLEFERELEKRVKDSLLSIQKIDRKYINSDFKKLTPTFVSDYDINKFGEMAPIEEVNFQLEKFRNVLNGVKYLGPLRSLANMEKKVYSFPQQTPIGLSGELFFNYFEINKDKEVSFYRPDGEFSVQPLKKAFSVWLDYFEIADSFDTTYDEVNNTIYGKIKPKMLSEEVRMDSLGVGFSQLAPIILLCLTSGFGDTILLEQPELHLHPSVQQKFGDFLLVMSKDKQIIVETHSDHLLNRVRRRVAESQTNTEGSVGIYFAQREEGLTEFRLAELDSNGRYKMTDFPKGFFDQGAEDAFVILKNTLLQGEEVNTEVDPDEAPF